LLETSFATRAIGTLLKRLPTLMAGLVATLRPLALRVRGPLVLLAAAERQPVGRPSPG